MTRPIATRTNHDHFGFYEVGPYKTYSKIEAIEISARTGIDLRWNFNCSTFDNFDWKTEPPGDLSFWYAERAQQIREKYDYIVLMYSGGADSWNMLKAFVDNNIYIDEIAHYIVHEGTPATLDDHWNAEVLQTSYPNAKRLIETNPIYKTTVQRVIDGGLHVLKKITTVNPLEYFYQESAYFFGTWGATLAEIRHSLPAYQQLIDKKQTVCFVWGYDKPLVSVDESNKFRIKFSEYSSATIVKPKHQFENRQDKFDEAFYWTPDLPEMICKQAHVIRRYVENIHLENADGIFVKKIQKKEFNYNISFTRSGQLLMLTTDGIHALIYPGWNPASVVATKPSSPILTDKDLWWYKDTNDKTTAWYTRGLIELRQHIKKIHPKWWFEYRTDPADPKSLKAGIKMCENFYELN